MKWLTRNEVRKAARKSGKAALDVSIKHYDQMIAATAKEFKEAESKRLVNIWSTFCGLCERYSQKNTLCPLKGKFCFGVCVDEWANLRKMLEQYKARKTTWREVQKAMREVRRKLKSAHYKNQ